MLGALTDGGAGSGGAALRLSLEPATRGIFVFEQKKTWIVFQIAFFSEKQRDKTLPIHVLDLKEYYTKFSFLLKTLDNLRTCVLCSMWCFENPFNSGQRTLECCQAGSIDGNVNGLGSFFLATSKMTLGSLDVGQFNFSSAKDGQIHQPPERPDPVASATQSFNKNCKPQLAARCSHSCNFSDIDDISWFPLGYLLGPQLNDRNVRTSFRGTVWVLLALCVRPQSKAPWTRSWHRTGRPQTTQWGVVWAPCCITGSDTRRHSCTSKHLSWGMAGYSNGLGLLDFWFQPLE